MSFLTSVGLKIIANDETTTSWQTTATELAVHSCLIRCFASLSWLSIQVTVKLSKCDNLVVRLEVLHYLIVDRLLKDRCIRWRLYPTRRDDRCMIGCNLSQQWPF